MADGLLAIGAFSRASSLSIKTLRAYHEAGILVPARIDPQSGYRMYGVDQLADSAVIRRLRMLDLPLAQVKRVLDARDPELTRRILERHQRAMQDRLEETERIVAELQSGAAPVTHTPVHVRGEEPVDTVRVVGRVTEAEFGPWAVRGFERLGAFLASAGAEPSGPAGALYDPEIADEGVENVELFLPVARPPLVPERDRDVAVGEVPAATVAVMVHVGDYGTMVDTYRLLGAWVAEHAEPTGERIREWYRVSAFDVADPADYRTEVCWPINPPA